MNDEKIITVELDGFETDINFDDEYQYSFVKNIGKAKVYGSREANITPDAENVFSLSPGESIRLLRRNNTEALYFLGEGKIEIWETNDANSPFLNAPGGGDSPGGTYTGDGKTVTVTGNVISAQKGIDGIDIGGRNYLKSSSDLPLNQLIVSKNNVDITSDTVKSMSGKWYQISLNDLIVESSRLEIFFNHNSLTFPFDNKNVVMSTILETDGKISDIRASIFSTTNGHYFSTLTKTAVLDNSKLKVECYFNASERPVLSANNRDFNLILTIANCSYIKFCNISYQYGNKPTDWTPAPEDKADASELADLKAYIGYTDPDILGLEADFENNKFTRLAGAAGRNGGADFDKFPMFGGRRRCNVLDDGTITAYCGDNNYNEDGSNGQVMVYQPKFYYKVVPLKLEPIANGEGYHSRKARYYISATPKPGFSLHPAFYGENGEPVDYVLLSAFEGSVYDVSEETYLANDERVVDLATDYLCSIKNVKPCSIITRANGEQLAKNRGTGWHTETIKTTAMNQMLAIIEYGMFNMQPTLGKGVVDISGDTTANRTVITGTTSSLGNASGMADGENGKVSVSYRGMENPWGNIWKYINGINGYVNDSGALSLYICSDTDFIEGQAADNYKKVDFAAPSAVEGGYVSAFGYSVGFDWLFIPTESNGNSNLPVGDTFYYAPQFTEQWRVLVLGGYWRVGVNAGMFCTGFQDAIGDRGTFLGTRMTYFPSQVEVVTNA